MCMHTHAHRYTHANAYRYMRMPSHTIMYIYTHICIIHTHTHTHMHAKNFICCYMILFCSTVDTCTERCQVTICGACFYINRPTNIRQCPRRSYSKDFRCLQQWINCTYKKTVQSQVRWLPRCVNVSLQLLVFIQFICMIAAAADPIRAGGLKLPYGKGGLASDLFTIL